LALVQNGDMITLDVANRQLMLDVDDATLAARRKAWQPTHPQATRGYVRMYQETVMQANEGADLEFLRGNSGAPVPRDSH
jgi:dihydroxy-acid dehydratase